MSKDKIQRNTMEKGSVNKFQMLWLILGALITGVTTWFIEDSIAQMSISWAFLAVLGSYLTIDLVKLIKDTSALEAGYYKDIDKKKYYISFIIFLLLLAETWVLKGVYSREVDGLLSSYTIGCLFVIGGLVSGIQANKIATNIDGDLNGDGVIDEEDEKLKEGTK